MYRLIVRRIMEMTDTPKQAATSSAAAPPDKRRYDRSIVEGPLRLAVWKIAWPTMLTNIIGGFQGIIDHAMVGHLVGFKANAAIGVAWQIFIVVIVFITSLFTGMSVLVARFAGAGDARTPMILGIVMTALNLALNVILIRGLGPIPAFGVAGSAMGTMIASGLVALYAMVKLWRGGWVVSFPRRGGFGPDWNIIRSLFRFGLPTGIQWIAMNIGGVFMLAFIGSLAQSAAAQAAFAISYTQLFSLITWTSIGLLGAAAAVAGQNLGAGRPDRADAAVHMAARFGLAGAALIGCFFLFFPQQLLAVFGMREPAVVEIGVQLLRVLSVSGLFIAVALTYTGGLQGTGDTKSPLYISIVSQIIVPLGICFVVRQTSRLDPIDIWIAILVGHATRCALSVIRFKQGKWRNIAVDIEQKAKKGAS